MRSDDGSSVTPCGVSHVAVVTGDLDGYRAFYEQVIGLTTTMVLGAGRGHGRQAVLVAGEVMLHVFEVPGYDPRHRGFTPTMFERGRLDHLGFTVPDETALAALRDRLLAVDATSGVIRRLGPMLSVRFHDPDGFEGEVNCLDRTYDPASVRDEDEIVDPRWLVRIATVLRAPQVPGTDPTRPPRPDPGTPSTAGEVRRTSEAHDPIQRSPMSASAGGPHDDHAARRDAEAGGPALAGRSRSARRADSEVTRETRRCVLTQFRASSTAPAADPSFINRPATGAKGARHVE